MSKEAEQQKEVKLNPYNKPDTGQKEDIERGLVGANDSLAYVAPKKTVVMDPMNPHGAGSEATDEGVSSADSGTSDTKYQKEDFKKRYDDARTAFNKYKQQRDQEVADLKKALRDAGPKFVPPKTPEELATFRAENPDLYAVIESVAGLHTQTELSNVKEELEEVQKSERKAARAAAKASLREAHPDLDNILRSEDYRMWVDSQPKEIQNWVNGTHPTLASRGLDLYKKDRNIAHAANKEKETSTTQKADAAELVSIPSKPDVDAKVDPNTAIWDRKWVNNLSTKPNPKTGKSDYQEWYETYGYRALAERRIR